MLERLSRRDSSVEQEDLQVRKVGLPPLFISPGSARIADAAETEIVQCAVRCGVTASGHAVIGAEIFGAHP